MRTPWQILRDVAVILLLFAAMPFLVLFYPSKGDDSCFDFRLW